MAFRENNFKKYIIKPYKINRLYAHFNRAGSSVEYRQIAELKMLKDFMCTYWEYF